LPNNPIYACRLLAGQAVQTQTPQKIADETGGPGVKPTVIALDRLQPCPNLPCFAAAFAKAEMPGRRG
jgi:hypothetical protein